MRVLLLVVTLALSACVARNDPATPGGDLPPPPDIAEGPLDPATVEALEHRFWLAGRPRPNDIQRIAGSSDVRVAWPLVDLLRFEQDSPDGEHAEEALATLTGVGPAQFEELAAALVTDPARPWVLYSELLLAWAIPAPPDYLRYKAAQHRIFDQRWDPFFDPRADLDWRRVSWGGVPRDGIPDLTDPVTVPADEAGFLEPDDIVFGVQIDGAARAYPRRILEVHEVVNDRLGGTRIVLSFCTLCGVANAHQATLSGPGNELVAGPLEFGTSGLLFRSNKLMHDRQTESLFEQFTGRAVTGPLAEAGAQLERIPLNVTTWREWREDHLESTVVTIPEGEDREKYDGTFLDPTGATPAFPTGATDERLAPKTVVLGVDRKDGTPLAFPIEATRRAIGEGRRVTLDGVSVESEDGALVVRDAAGAELPTRQAFWFAWSQFHPDTELWSPEL